jgi:hypothetical protein
MTKENYIGLGLVGLPFMCVGAIIGGLIVNRNNTKQLDMVTNIFTEIDRTLRNDAELRRTNEKLKRKLDSKR